LCSVQLLEIPAAAFQAINGRNKSGNVGHKRNLLIGCVLWLQCQTRQKQLEARFGRALVGWPNQLFLTDKPG
jgi:hypothetical protein